MPNLTLVNEEEDPVGRDRAVGEENRIELDIGTAKIEHPGQTGKVNQLSPLLTFVCCKLGRITFFGVITLRYDWVVQIIFEVPIQICTVIFLNNICI